MYLLENVFTNEHGEAITVLQLLTKFKMALTEIDNYLNEYGNRLNSIEFLNVTQQQEINILKSHVQTLQTNVSNLQLTVGDYLLRFTDLDIRLGVINGKITNNTNDISTLNTLVSSIQTSITNINNQINTINLNIDGINTRLDIALSSISSINSDLVDLDKSIDLINTQLSNLAAFITDFESRLAVLESKFNNIVADITTINNKNAVQDTTLESHDARITLLENSGVGGGNLQLLATKIINYNIPQGGGVLDSGNYIFQTLPAGTDFTKVKIIEQVFGVSAGDADALSRVGINFAYYIQNGNGVDVFSLSKLGAPAPQSMNFNVYYHFYKVL